MTLSLGDAWVPGRLMHKSGLWDVVDEVPWANRDTPRAMVAFYMCSRLASRHAEEWWRTSVASLPWPGARPGGQGAGEFPGKAGSRESTLAPRESHARLVPGGLGDDTDVTVDSTGLPNGSGTCLTRADAREGRAGVEARLAVVAQRSTATRPWWELLPGSASDATGLGRIIARCEGIGVHAGPCPTGAGHRADANLDEPCDDGHRCPAPYVTRPRPNPPGTGRPSRGRRGASSRGRASPGTETATCSRGGSPSWSARATTSPRGPASDRRLAPVRRAPQAVRGGGEEEAGHGPGLRGTREPGRVRPALGNAPRGGGILPERCVRQGIEQPDDVAKGHAKLLPTRCHTVETFTGHVLLSMIGSSVMRLVQIRPDDGEAYLASRMEALRSQGCILYKGRLVPDEPTRPANEECQLFDVLVQ